MRALTALSATEMARQIRDGTLSPVDLIDAHIDRIEAVNPAINALVIPTFNAARQQAQAAAEAVQRGDPLGPLHGVPFTVKDSYDVAGVRSTCGLVSRAEHIPAQDATLVARMRKTGAILLGKTNTPDSCGDYETHNLLFGQTNNPWDVTRSPGGSTGGEAALIAAECSPLGLGSDIAGSIRLPAHFCGITGLRPTSPTALPDTGYWPPAPGRLGELNSMGPMARRVEDVALAFDVLHERTPQPIDTAALRGAPLAFWLDDGIVPGSGAVRGAVRAAVDVLQEGGMQPVRQAPAARRLAAIGWTRYFVGPTMRDWGRGFGNGEAWSLWGELWRALLGRPRVSSGPLLMWLIIIATQRLAGGVDGARWRERLREQFCELVSERGVAVCPVFPTTAPRHTWNRRGARALLTSGYTTWVNLAGLPGLTVPVGRSSRLGLPVGVQLIGAPHTEATLLAAGLVVQQALQPVWHGPVI
jgi:Asp-tRNA(Asn)/Glu-tRNA(Gln) amidotransferase A subunit family amidase